MREYPRIEEPVVTVRTDYPGASAEIIESQVTQPLEESLAGIEGIDFMNSISRPEESQITIQFNINRDPDIASNDVRDRVARARRSLPDDVDEPVVAKREADAQPIIWMSLESDRHSSLELSDAADRIVKDRLQSLPGISEIRIFGERRYAMRVWVDPVRLAAYGLTVQDVETALRAQNVEIPAGRIESSDREFTVLAETDLRSQTAFEDIVLRETDGYPVRIGDVGHVEVDAQDKRVAFRINGKTGVGVGVIKQSTANPLEVSTAIRQELPSVSDSLPDGMKLKIAYDTSIFIERSIYAVVESILIAVLLVVLVIFVFLRSVRATLIPVVTIPVSMISTFALMYLFGFSINTLTLLAFVLAVGLVVDDAIVMLENIHRHIEEGMKPFAAAIKGSKEIAFACIAMTLTLAAVYAPVSFQTGRTGRLFAEFALTLAGAVLVSGFVALSLSPMMCSKLLRHQDKHNFLYRAIESGLNGLTGGYRRLLGRALSGWPVMLAIYIVLAGTAAGLFLSLPSETAPTEDRGNIIGIAYAPEGSTLEYMDRYARQIEKILSETKGIDSYGVVQGNPTVTRAVMFLRLQDWDVRERKQQDITAEVAPKLRALPGVMAFVNNPPSLGQSGFGQPISLVVQTTESYEALNGYVQQILDQARKSPLLTNLRSDLELNKPEIKISVDRDKVADLGLDVAVVGRTLETMLGGRQVTRYKYAGKQYDVIVQIGDDNRRTPDQLANIYIRSATGDMIPLSSVAQLRETVSPKELNRFNKLRSATITSSVPVGSNSRPGVSGAGADRPRRSAAGGADRLCRPVARVQGSQRRLLCHAWPVADIHLSRAGGAVRELHRSPGHHADGAAGDHRRAGDAEADRRHQQHLQPDRHDHPGRTDHQARHPDRRLRQSEPGARHAGPRSIAGSRGPAPAAHSHDHGRDGAGRDPPCRRHRCRRRKPPPDRPGDRRRINLRHGIYPVCGARRLYLADPLAPPHNGRRGGAGHAPAGGISCPGGCSCRWEQTEISVCNRGVLTDDPFCPCRSDRSCRGNPGPGGGVRRRAHQGRCRPGGWPEADRRQADGGGKAARSG